MSDIRRQVAALTLLSTVVGCTQAVTDPRQVVGPVTTAFNACVPPAPTNGAGIRIKMPRHLNFQVLARDVDYTDTPVSDTTETEAGAPNEPSDPTQPAEPFHIYTKKIKSKRWVLVKVIIPNNSSYRFYVKGDINGVGSADNNAGGILCGRRLVRGDNSPGSTARKVAFFWIDMTKLAAASPAIDPQFNIAVIPNAFPDTPIFIDPKVHNEG